jgi:hypothetical protein
MGEIVKQIRARKNAGIENFCKGALGTKQDAADYTSQTTRNIERMMRLGMPFIRITKRASRFRRSDIDAWLRTREVNKITTV